MEKESFIHGLISIIIPVYNVRQYLDKCIQSVVNQSYRNIEIIIVDDGSNDGSETICDEWAKKDDRIRVFHKKNGGSSDARNLGLRQAKGEFIGFVDSDDYIKSDMYELLYEAMNDGADIACCGTTIVYPDKWGRKPTGYDKAPNRIVMNNKEAMKELLMIRYLSFSSCDKIFKRKLFVNTCFPVGRTCEDLPTIYKVVKASSRVINIGTSKYFYRYRADSISRKKFEIDRMSYVIFARDIYRDIKLVYPDLSKVAEAMYIRNVIAIIYEIEKTGDAYKYEKIYKRLIKLLKRMQVNIFLNQYITGIMKKDVVNLIMWDKIKGHRKGI